MAFKYSLIRAGLTKDWESWEEMRDLYARPGESGIKIKTEAIAEALEVLKVVEKQFESSDKVCRDAVLFEDGRTLQNHVKHAVAALTEALRPTV